jgi:hypothetical protein
MSCVLSKSSITLTSLSGSFCSCFQRGSWTADSGLKIKCQAGVNGEELPSLSLILTAEAREWSGIPSLCNLCYPGYNWDLLGGAIKVTRQATKICVIRL